MFDAFTKVVSQSDARGEFLAPGQLDALSSMVSEANKRIDSVNRITSNSSTIVANAARALFAEQPQQPQPPRLGGERPRAAWIGEVRDPDERSGHQERTSFL